MADGAIGLGIGPMIKSSFSSLVICVNADTVEAAFDSTSWKMNSIGVPGRARLGPFHPHTAPRAVFQGRREGNEAPSELRGCATLHRLGPPGATRRTDSQRDRQGPCDES